MLEKFLLQQCEDAGNPVGVAHDKNVVQEGQQPLVIRETMLPSKAGCWASENRAGIKESPWQKDE